MSTPQLIRCTVLISHSWITCQSLELKMVQASQFQQRGLRVANRSFKKKIGSKGWMPDRPELLFNLCFKPLDLTCQKLFQEGRLWDYAFLLPVFCLNTTGRALVLGLTPNLPCFSGKYTSLYKYFISFDVCLRALMCWKGFFKVCWHLPWMLSVGFFHFPCPSFRLITLGTLLTSSIFVKTVWHSICVHSSSEGDLSRSSESCRCVVSSTRESL